MSAEQGPAVDAAAPAAAPAPFTVLAGDPQAMVCEGDVCFIPEPPAGRSGAATPAR
ncbi:hypothetical protein [Agromyces archimandritae]|uniref:Uncharacterized protein n=1 Tax=Agromyces archimandritae TaxID=2781962 RepID=A0A975INQ9_9MICO|nr:hypothetical protein [Agromyces archimandritae]QTX04853.1 hypothetical protein G127AT_00870 [Agromyces archimandritae]